MNSTTTGEAHASGSRKVLRGKNGFLIYALWANFAHIVLTKRNCVREAQGLRNLRPFVSSCEGEIGREDYRLRLRRSSQSNTILVKSRKLATVAATTSRLRRVQTITGNRWLHAPRCVVDIAVNTKMPMAEGPVAPQFQLAAFWNASVQSVN